MPRLTALAPLAALALAATSAGAQVQSVSAPAPAGLAVPMAGVAAAEEATALSVTPAGPGFVGRPALHYLHQEPSPGPGAADGVWAAAPLGPLAASLSMEWLRPAAPDQARSRRTSLGLAIGDGRAVSFGVGWRWWSSPDPALDALHAWDLGLTLRPWRHLSIGASAQGRDARLAGVPLPVRYDLGVATRLLDDGLTLAADLLADDRARDDFHPTHLALGAQLELSSGLGLAAQVRLPLRDLPAAEDGVATVLALTWNAPHAGWIGGVTTHRGGSAWFAGVRTSGERSRAASSPGAVPRLDLPRLLTTPRTLFFSFGPADPYGALLARLEQARTDGEVAAVVLQVDGVPLGAGRIEELRASLASLRARKPVLVYLTGGGTGAYWLASGATAVAMPPSAALLLTGLSRSELYLKDGLARLGVVVEVARAGSHKSAPEPLTRNEPSPEAREMTGALLDAVSGRLVADVAAGRRLAPEKVRDLVDRGLLTAAEAKAAGLCDELIWPDELDAWASRLVGRPVKTKAGHRQAPARAAQRWGQPPAIAVVRLEGVIASGQARREPLGDALLAGAGGTAEALRRAAADRRVKAIVLRVESPGGDAQASDLIWRAVVQARRKKPVVVSMGDVAASGGYLAAVGADLILAEPSTLTGSIGVFALKPDLSGLLEKLSLHRDSQRRGEVAELFSLTKPWTPAERAAVERMIDSVYALFLDRVAEGRKLPRAEVEKVAGGRVWTGAQALDRKLVDRLGGLPEALEAARQRAGLGRDEQVEVIGLGGRAELRLEGPLAEAVAPLLTIEEGEPALLRAAAALPELRTAAVLAELGPVLALPLEWLGPGPAAGP